MRFLIIEKLSRKLLSRCDTDLDIFLLTKTLHTHISQWLFTIGTRSKPKGHFVSARARVLMSNICRVCSILLKWSNFVKLWIDGQFWNIIHCISKKPIQHTYLVSEFLTACSPITNYFWKNMRSKLVAQTIALLLAPFEYKSVKYSARSESLKFVINLELRFYFVNRLNMVIFYFIFYPNNSG